MFQLSEQLHQRLSQGRHDVGRVQDGQPSDDAHRQLPDFELLIVHGNEQGGQVFGLGQVIVETLVQTFHHAEAHVRVLNKFKIIKITQSATKDCTIGI